MDRSSLTVAALMALTKLTGLTELTGNRCLDSILADMVSESERTTLGKRKEVGDTALEQLTELIHNTTTNTS